MGLNYGAEKNTGGATLALDETRVRKVGHLRNRKYAAPARKHVFCTCLFRGDVLETSRHWSMTRQLPTQLSPGVEILTLYKLSKLLLG